MATTDENKTIRQEQSREVARDAAEAYRAAKGQLLNDMATNREDTAELDTLPLARGEYLDRRLRLRGEAKQLARQARDLGIERTTVAGLLGVSRQTIHEWLNEGES